MRSSNKITVEHLEEQKNSKRSLIQKCIYCGNIEESALLLEKCSNCHKMLSSTHLFCTLSQQNGPRNCQNCACYLEVNDDLNESDLIKGIQVLW